MLTIFLLCTKNNKVEFNHLVYFARPKFFYFSMQPKLIHNITHNLKKKKLFRQKKYLLYKKQSDPSRCLSATCTCSCCDEQNLSFYLNDILINFCKYFTYEYFLRYIAHKKKAYGLAMQFFSSFLIVYQICASYET